MTIATFTYVFCSGIITGVAICHLILLWVNRRDQRRQRQEEAPPPGGRIDVKAEPGLMSLMIPTSTLIMMLSESDKKFYSLDLQITPELYEALAPPHFN